MAVPDFAQSRRQLRRARVQDALQMPRHGVMVDRHRNRLLEPLAAASTDELTDFESLAERMVDTVASVALCELDEAAEDQLIVMLMCLQVLAEDGQFARLRLLANRLASVGRLFEIERPYLHAAITAFSHALRGKESVALSLLERKLGTGEAVRAKRRRNREQLNDVLVAAFLRAWLRDSNNGEVIVAARDAALRIGDGSLLTFIDAIRAWGMATRQARPLPVLQAADATFRSHGLAAYVEQRGIQALFPSQIRAIRAGATHDENRMVSLPTSSGKTLIAELRIAAALTRNPSGKAIYIAPYRLLARQVERDLRRFLARTLEVNVRDLGSGYDPTLSGMDSVDVVICTPERMDALLRLSTSNRAGADEAANFLANCCVLVLDELHLVGRPGRGPRFELLLARIRFKYPALKVLGLSAASLDADELAEWIGGSEAITGARRPTGTLELLWEPDGRLYQRVARQQPTLVAELPRSSGGALDDASELILSLADQYQPALAVCVSRQNAENLASKLVRKAPDAGTAWRNTLSETSLDALNQAIEEVRALMGDEHPLAQYMSSGIAFHHAGVPTHALEQIERLASRGILRAVSATTTVAEGADLPFRVVVIPHLNFPGSTGRLERDLYLNIIGRAGRANVSVEGIVFILGSNAQTLRNHVRRSLWSTSARDRLRGQLPSIDAVASDVDGLSAYFEVQSQVMGWLGDGDNYVDNQAMALAEGTLSYFSGNRGQKQRIVGIFNSALSDLERTGFALAASPYRLTEQGRRARMTGLSPPSVVRLRVAIDASLGGWLRDLPDVVELTPEMAVQISRLVFEATEVFEHSLWIRREIGSNQAARLRALHAFAFESARSHEASDTFVHDVELLGRWIVGDTYLELASRAPTFDHARALFGGEDQTKRTSDAAEYIGKLTYPATWVWSGVQVLAGAFGEEMPAFIKAAIEYGLPSETAVQLASRVSLTRPAAMFLAEQCGRRWDEARQQLSDDAYIDEVDDYLTRLDSMRLRNLAEQLRVEMM